MRPVAYPSTARVLSLIGGVLILIEGIIIAALFAIGATVSFFNEFGFGAAILIAFGVVALLFGIVVLAFAARLKSNPASHTTSGVIIVVVSLLSIAAGGGFFIGLILGLVGGILAIVWKAPA